jgi:hypothetical protein
LFDLARFETSDQEIENCGTMGQENDVFRRNMDTKTNRIQLNQKPTNPDWDENATFVGIVGQEIEIVCDILATNLPLTLLGCVNLRTNKYLV